MNIRSILVPIDFSPCSYNVANQAAAMAQTFGASLLWLHVSDPPAGLSLDALIQPRPDMEPVKVKNWLTDSARSQMERYQSVARFHKVPSRTMLREGPVADSILEAAEISGSDMIVMGTHGREGISRFMLGSVAEQIIRHANVPVMTLRSQHKPECAARSCAWCTEDSGEAEMQLSAEVEG
jgi:nucleotide-binding universal stress UspA family protein